MLDLYFLGPMGQPGNSNRETAADLQPIANRPEGEAGSVFYGSFFCLPGRFGTGVRGRGLGSVQRAPESPAMGILAPSEALFETFWFQGKPKRQLQARGL